MGIESAQGVALTLRTQLPGGFAASGRKVLLIPDQPGTGRSCFVIVKAPPWLTRSSSSPSFVLVSNAPIVPEIVLMQTDQSFKPVYELPTSTHLLT